MIDEGRNFRNIIGHYPTGVCAITTRLEDGRPAGFIVGSFTSVSLNPLLVAFFPDRSSTTWPEISSTGRFCVNVLDEGQLSVCTALSAKGGDKFAGIGYETSQYGSPIIHGALAWFDCEIQDVHEAGDHYIVVGRVVDLALHNEGNPLVFHKGKYAKVIPA